MSKLRKKLEQHQVALGTHICMNEPVLTEILGWIGFDYLGSTRSIPLSVWTSWSSI